MEYRLTRQFRASAATSAGVSTAVTFRFSAAGGSPCWAERSFAPDTQSDQKMQNIIKSADFEVRGTSHYFATKAVGTMKMIDLMAVSTNSANNFTNSLTA
jgi:hypothetical protein